MVQVKNIFLLHENLAQPSYAGYFHQAEKPYFPTQFITFHLVMPILRYDEFSAKMQNRFCPTFRVCYICRFCALFKLSFAKETTKRGKNYCEMVQ